ncbi:UDP-3-O-(3-hydroxymyristoyl)glucosamine N-acyltransferase [Opitutales bacterium]|nr:UDP-3-O-(3-hydroxymyristoyl)glucosamine N-acyltransferase [Opitutales bacterium]
MSLSINVSELIDLFPSAIQSGQTSIGKLDGIANLRDAKAGDLSFLGNAKYKNQVEPCNASVILLPNDFQGKPSSNQLFIRLENPSRALAQVCELLEGKLYPSPSPGIHPTAFIEESASIHHSSSIGAFSYVGHESIIGPNCTINTHCHIGMGTTIGEGSVFYPGVKLLARCQIGKQVILNAGVVVGSEGYGFDQGDGSHQKIPHLGKVVIEDNVEVGANTCIDRARFEETKIGQGTKLDNLVQVGHNVKIGKNCLIVAQVGVSGSVLIEDEVIVGGQAGFAGHLKVGKGAKIAGQAGITKDVEPGAFLKGNPALPFHLAQRISVLQRKLPDLFNRFAQEKSKE